ncbi:hypothetical protein [Kineosporia babensis]|uniref:Uncharacterized protein n=1 Tax=Kineosporia babensis TaxID=499548 RepID=A0A9X1SVD8_9ACTN|nr:hypothetical protein [Kineosporia babensis]MCD5313571.1 hypothetical protein [Kineosporia babensis]
MDDYERTVEEDQLISELVQLLEQSGSAWKVSLAEPYWRLMRRVSPELQSQADLVVPSGTTAGSEIGLAWAAAFGLKPDYPKAFQHAVTAVESEALQLFIPKDGAGTLGKAIAHLSLKPERYTVAGLDDKKSDSAATLLGMLRMLWDNQERHAPPNGAAPEPASEEQAVAAVTVAVTLVQWFQAGTIREANGSS